LALNDLVTVQISEFDFLKTELYVTTFSANF